MRDGILKTPLADARVSLLTTDSIVVQDSIKVTLRKRNGERWGTANFVIQLPKKTCTYLLRATMDGYEDAWQSLSVLYTLHDAISLSYQYKDFTAKAMEWAMFAGVIPRARCVTLPHLTHLTTNMD